MCALYEGIFVSYLIPVMACFALAFRSHAIKCRTSIHFPTCAIAAELGGCSNIIFRMSGSMRGPPGLRARLARGAVARARSSSPGTRIWMIRWLPGTLDSMCCPMSRMVRPADIPPEPAAWRLCLSRHAQQTMLADMQWQQHRPPERLFSPHYMQKLFFAYPMRCLSPACWHGLICDAW